eukprot:m.105988 g.105988  ORF g.105988 m.105988 type:complete len:385 (+) comp13892_c0_seq2:164-1318(+)
MANFAKKLVSKKKRRYQENGFDLDMTFITKNLVAMGFPSEGTEGIYRNHMKDVKRFFDTYHKDKYKVYNLCSERDYNRDKFYGRVVKYPFDDHNAPPFLLMPTFCEDVHNYLQADQSNVAVIHCKAGKGRTGVMICAYLMHCRMWENTQEALDFYGHARTKNGKGVTIPSQIRYVHYYGRYIRENLQYRPTALLFKRIRLCGIPNFSKGTCVPFFTLRQGPDQVLIHKSKVYEGITKDQSEAVLVLEPPSPVCGDVKVEFFHKTGGGKDKMFNIWFNTFFVENDKMLARKPEIDKAAKDKKHKIYPEKFHVIFEFETIEGVTAEETQRESGAAEANAGATGGNWNAGDGGDSAIQDEKWDDSDLTTDDDDDEDDEFEGLPVSDV